MWRAHLRPYARGHPIDLEPNARDLPVSDNLTASFCERCGTRHEFRTPKGLNPLRKTRGFIGGLRHYLVSDEGLSDAMRDSMQAQESAVAGTQLDAFHSTFHLCLDCRQYTCNDCWNSDAGRCRSCAPLAGVDDLDDRLAAAVAASDAGAAPTAVPVFEHITTEPLSAESWPQADHEVYAAAAPTADEPVHSLAVIPPEPVFDDEPVEMPAAFDAEDTHEREEEPLLSAAVDEAPSEPIAAHADEEQSWQPQSSEAEYQMPEALVAAEAEEPEPIAASFEPDPPAEADVEAEADVAAEAEESMAAAEENEPARPSLRVMAWDDDVAYTAEESQPTDAIASTPEPEAGAEVTFEAETEAEVSAEATHDLEGDEWRREAVAAMEGEFQPAPIAATVASDQEGEPKLAEYSTVADDAEPVAAETEPVADDAKPMAAETEPVQPAPRRSGPMRDRIIRLPAPSPTAAPPQVRVAAEAESQEIAARRAQLEQLGLGHAPAAPAPEAAGHVLPYRSRPAEASQDAAATAIRESALLWEASAREVDSAGVTVQSCDECGLALSASARFCRRCGARQAQSA